jgi:hypothetical protein
MSFFNFFALNILCIYLYKLLQCSLFEESSLVMTVCTEVIPIRGVTCIVCQNQNFQGIFIISRQSERLSTNNDKNMLVMEDIWLSFLRRDLFYFVVELLFITLKNWNEEISRYTQKIH